MFPPPKMWTEPRCRDWGPGPRTSAQLLGEGRRVWSISKANAAQTTVLFEAKEFKIDKEELLKGDYRWGGSMSSTLCQLYWLFDGNFRATPNWQKLSPNPTPKFSKGDINSSETSWWGRIVEARMVAATAGFFNCHGFQWTATFATFAVSVHAFWTFFSGLNGYVKKIGSNVEVRVCIYRIEINNTQIQNPARMTKPPITVSSWRTGQVDIYILYLYMYVGSCRST